MKSGPEIVKAGLRQFFESAADDIEKMVENLKLGKVSSRNQVRSIPPVVFISSFSLGGTLRCVSVCVCVHR